MAACGDDSQTGSSASCDPALPAASGDVELVNSANGLEQPYWLVVPERYNGVDALALWLLLPGGLGDHQAAYAGWASSLHRAEAVVAVPNLQGASREVDVVVALIDDIASAYCVDRARVYAIGSSGSSRFTGALMERGSDHIAAFAVGLGGFGSTSETTPAVPFWSWTGNTDRKSTEPAALLWASRNGCDAEPTVVELGDGIHHWQFAGCDAPAEYYFLDGMGHQVPGHECPESSVYCAQYDDFDFIDEVRGFFEANPLEP